MGKETELRKELSQSVLAYVREKHPEEIDKAYSYFWDETNPDEYMAGTALELGFHNFEDWLLCDYRDKENSRSFIDEYISCCNITAKESLELLGRMKDSVLSLYEVVSVARDKRVLLKDLLCGGEVSLRDRMLTRGLSEGDIFAARLLTLDGGPAMSGCVYPYRSNDKKKVLRHIEKQFSRFQRNVKPGGTMPEFLKDYGDVFNIAWMHFILNQAEEKTRG